MTMIPLFIGLWLMFLDWKTQQPLKPFMVFYHILGNQPGGMVGAAKPGVVAGVWCLAGPKSGLIPIIRFIDSRQFLML